MKLIDEAKHWWRMFSMQCMGASVALIGAWNALPQKFQDAIPAQWVMGAAGALIALGMVGRMVKQDLPAGEGDGKQ